MSLRRYLPSAQFILVVASIAISSGLVFAADALTHRTEAPGSMDVTQNAPSTNDNSNWEAALYAIQAQNASSSLAAPNPDAVNQLLQAAQSANVTDTVGRTLLINLSNAKSQGLGDDIPTQDQIIATAMAQVKNQQTSLKNYTVTDLTVVPVSPSSLRTYGNGAIQAINAHPEASERATFLSIDYAVEGKDTTQPAKLAAIGAAYKAAALGLVAVPVPQTLVPLDLQIINDLLRTSATYDDMQAIISDPVRGLVGLQTYETLMDEEARVFTNIAQILNKDGILFSKDEPGAAWTGFLSP